MSSETFLSTNPFLAPWLRAAEAAGAWPAEMARQQAALVTAWQRQAMALMTAGWARGMATSPAPAPAPAPVPAEPVAAMVEAVAAPVETAIEAEPAVEAPKPARKPKAVTLRAAPQRRKAAKKKAPRATRH